MDCKASSFGGWCCNVQGKRQSVLFGKVECRGETDAVHSSNEFPLGGVRNGSTVHCEVSIVNTLLDCRGRGDLGWGECIWPLSVVYFRFAMTVEMYHLKETKLSLVKKFSFMTKGVPPQDS